MMDWRVGKLLRRESRKGQEKVGERGKGKWREKNYEDRVNSYGCKYIRDWCKYVRSVVWEIDNIDLRLRLSNN